jgi:hypothetical protein
MTESARSASFWVARSFFWDGEETRASEFQNIYNLGKQYNATAMIFWNLGPEISPSSYEVNPNTPFTWNTIIQNAPR